MNSWLISVVAAIPLAGISAAPSADQAKTWPSTTRKMVLDKAEAGYRWKLIGAPVPALGEHQLLIRVHAVSLNRGDLEMLDPGSDRDYSGFVVASDAAGEVIAVGGQVQGFKPGMRVTSLYFHDWTDGPPNAERMRDAHGASVDGVLAEYLVIDDTGVAPAPAGLSHEEAAALPTAGLTAWRAVMTRAPEPGDFVLVQGTGGVSTFALQFAVAAKARVIVTSSSDDKLKRAEALGAHAGINYRTTPEWPERVLELTNGHGADVIVDVGGKSTLALSARSLAYDGTLSIVGGLTGYDGMIPARNVLNRNARALGIYVGSRADYLRMSEFIVKHQVRPVVDRVFPIEQFEEALKLLESGDFVGKIVLKF